MPERTIVDATGRPYRRSTAPANRVTEWVSVDDGGNGSRPVRKTTRSVPKLEGEKLRQIGYLKDIADLGTKDYDSRQVDPFSHTYSAYDLIPPLYTPDLISRVLSISETLSQCVRCLVVNIHLQGHEFKYLPPDDNAEVEPSDADLNDKDRLRQLLGRPNSMLDFRALRKRTGREYYTGNSTYWEILRDISAEIREIYHAPARSIRMTAPGKEAVEHVEYYRDVRGAWQQRQRLTRFRKFAQLTIGGNPRWFKQFGDPRQLDYRSGEFGESVPLKYQASEILPFIDFSSDTPYGEPAWASEIVRTAGAKMADDVNYLYFENNSIPPFVIKVYGGALTEESMHQIEDMIKARKQGGAQAFHGVWLLQALPESITTDDLEEKVMPVKIEIQPLTQFMQSDALFTNYTDKAGRAMKRKYRLPDILLGDTKDFNRATAEVALQQANQQIFAPEREEFDSYIDRTIIADMGIGAWRLHSLGPKTTRDDDALKALAPVADVLTVGQIQELWSGITGKPVAQLDESISNMLFGQLRGAFGQDTPEDAIDDNIDKLMNLRERLVEKINADN